MLRDLVTTVLEILAVALIAIGAALIYIPSAFIVVGLAAGTFAWRLTPKTVTETPG